MSTEGAYQFSQVEASDGYWVGVGVGTHDVGSTIKSRWAFKGGNKNIPLEGSSKPFYAFHRDRTWQNRQSSREAARCTTDDRLTIEQTNREQTNLKWVN